MDPIRKEGKKRALMHMRKMAMDHMKGGLDDLMAKKVSVMAPDKHGLEEGLQSAHDMVASGAMDKLAEAAKGHDPEEDNVNAEDKMKHSEENSLHDESDDEDHEPAGNEHDGTDEDEAAGESTEHMAEHEALHGGDEKKSPEELGQALGNEHPFSGMESPGEEDAEQELMAAASEMSPEELDKLIAMLEAHKAQRPMA